mmetsp:Transcript_14177/g.26248  ORF Transcript_14177/g.26248 Transcript_14177/m.26248 type:complete len:302 (+) Transcript_14177:416-1321(+)
MPMPMRTRTQTEEEKSDAAMVVPHPLAEQDLNIPKVSLKMKMVQNPAPNFFKDEGGKKHVLCATFVLESPETSKVAQVGKIGFTPTLCYENGNEVEDGPEIFEVVSLEPKIVTRTNQKVVIKFRIEKVSRRKDGQRFKVRIDIDQKQTPCDIGPVFTSPVCVLSKRKFNTGTQGKKRSNSQSSAKRLKTIASSSSTESMRDSTAPVSATALALQKAFSSLESKVAQLTNRVEFLEGELKHRDLEYRRYEHRNPRQESELFVKKEPDDSDAASLTEFMHDAGSHRSDYFFELGEPSLDIGNF